MTAAVVIPALNEQATIERVVGAVRGGLGSRRDVRVIVVDDGSSDDTAALAAGAGADVLSLPFNLGVGGAVRTGLRHAVRSDADRVVIMDADDQHDAGDADALLAAIDQGAGLAVGSRFAGRPTGDEPAYRMGLTRRSAHRLLNRLVSRRTGTTITDATSGFRAMDRDVAALLADEYPVEYLADTVEVLFLVARAGHPIVEVPIRMRPRLEGTASTRGTALAIQYLRVLVGLAGSTMVRRRGSST